jgi:hypothetical protein
MSNGIQRAQDAGAIQASDWAAMREQANVLIRSGFLPKSITTPEQAIAIMMAGREFRISPIQAIRSLYIVDGRVGMEAKLMKALVHRDLPEATLEIVESNEEHCTVKAGRPGRQAKPYTWTLKDAERAGLLSKDTWKKYPRDMLRNRAISEACRAEFSDVTGGAMDREELYDVIETTGTPQLMEYDDVTPLLEKIQAADSVKELGIAIKSVTEKSEKGMISPADREVLGAAYTKRRSELQQSTAEQG